LGCRVGKDHFPEWDTNVEAPVHPKTSTGASRGFKFSIFEFFEQPEFTIAPESKIV
jgi:hypothetical protein